MSPTPAIAPTVATYAARSPYLTIDEWTNAPTSIDIDDLVPGGTEQEQSQALADCIIRASSWIDDVCQQVLAATVDTAYGRWRVDRYGMVQVPLPCKPVLEVSAVAVGRTAGQLAALGDLSGIEFRDGGVIAVTVHGYRAGEHPLVQVTYVNGWPNTLTAEPVNAGDTSLQVDPAVGIYPGSVLTVSDGAATEQVTVDATYTAGASTLPLAAALTNAHNARVAVSSLPPRVKQAAILLTSALVQTRGNDAIVLAAMKDPSAVSGSDDAATSNVKLALSLLASLRRAW